MDGCVFTDPRQAHKTLSCLRIVGEVGPGIDCPSVLKMNRTIYNWCQSYFIGIVGGLEALLYIWFSTNIYELRLQQLLSVKYPTPKDRIAYSQYQLDGSANVKLRL